MNKILTAKTPLPPGCTIGEDSIIECEEFVHAGLFTVEKNVQIESRRVELGYGSRIEHNVVVRSIRGRMAIFKLGDHALLSFGIQVLVPEFTTGDYTQVFNSCLISGYKPTNIGHNCWVGQGAILNSAETLSIGNNVRMGGCQIWTHVASGELLEGSRFYGEKPVIIEDNVWLMGFGHMVAPGVTLGRNTVIMAGSVVTKSTEPFHTYSGVPAVDITAKVPAWNPMTLDEKMILLGRFVREFLDQYPKYCPQVHIVDTDLDGWFQQLHKLTSEGESTETLIFLRSVDLTDINVPKLVSVFDVNSKQYIKRRTKLEEAWFRFANGYRARFIPCPTSLSTES